MLIIGLIGGFNYATNQMTEVAQEAAAKVKKANDTAEAANARLNALETQGETVHVQDTKR